MKYVLNLRDRQIFYDDSYVFIDGTVYATYDNTGVTWFNTTSLLAKFKYYSDHSWLLYDGEMLEAHDRDKTLRNQLYNKILGTYTGTHAGALASYIAYKHSLTTPCINKTTTVAKDIQPKQNTNEKHTQSSSSSKAVPVKKEPAPKINLKKDVPREAEPKYIPPKVENRYENSSIYKPPKQDHVYKKIDFTPPPAPIPGGSSAENSGCISPIAGLAIAIFVLVIAIKMIPQSWRDLSKYIPEGDTGITICFFSSIIGAVLSIIIAILKKKNIFTTSMATFVGVCGISIVINTIIQIKEILEGTHEFLGFALIDIPLSIFASVLGQFQFALPIGIGVLIICGIIHLVKKNK